MGISQILNEVIAHARTHTLFGGTLAPRITLLHAQLAHAQGCAVRARTCYRVAAQLAGEAGDAGGEAAARAGEVALLIGLRARARVRASGGKVPPLAEEELPQGDGGEEEEEDAELVRLGREVAGTCRGFGGAMRAVGEVIEGVLTTEILKAKFVFHPPEVDLGSLTILTISFCFQTASQECALVCDGDPG